MAGKGVWGMIGVDMIGQIRRAYFEQRRSIKEIVRTLRVSRTTVRKVVRGKDTEFKYERSVQPAPKLGEWIEVLTAILETESKLPRRGGDPVVPRLWMVGGTMFTEAELKPHLRPKPKK